MKKWQATCPDGWKSKTVEADDMDEAAKMLKDELQMHLRETHQMEMSSNPDEMHQAVVEHVVEVMEE